MTDFFSQFCLFSRYFIGHVSHDENAALWLVTFTRGTVWNFWRIILTKNAEKKITEIIPKLKLAVCLNDFFDYYFNKILIFLSLKPRIFQIMSYHNAPYYSDKYTDEKYEYRHVHIPKEWVRSVPKEKSHIIYLV